MDQTIGSYMDRSELASKIEHTFLKPTAGKSDIENLCSESLKNHFYGICINSCWVPFAKVLLRGTPAKIITTVGFPLGANATEVKEAELDYALTHGAHEIDFVVNIGWIKSGKKERVADEFNRLVEMASPKKLKVIMETTVLTDEEKKLICQMAVEAGIAFVKTSTGFGQGGATIEDVKLLKEAVGKKAEVKASGGISSLQIALSMLDAGASRLGTSYGVAIINELPST